MKIEMDRLFWICVGGGVGTGARYLVGLWVGERWGDAFPYGTLIVNVVGCFLMGLIMQLTAQGAALSPGVRLILTTGFLGGFTTYSSFNSESTRLLREGQVVGCLLNFGLTSVGCFAAGLLGLLLAQRFRVA